MAVDTKISALTAAGSATSTDEVPVNQGGTTKKVTLAQVSAAIGSLGSGKIVQVVNFQTGALATGTSTIPFDDTVPQITEGTEIMTLAITPVSATNKLKIDVVISLTVDGASWTIAALFQDSTANALAAMMDYQNIGTGAQAIVFTHFMAAGTTSATTFRIRVGKDAGGTWTINGPGGLRRFGGVMATSITITEIIP